MRDALRDISSHTPTFNVPPMTPGEAAAVEELLRDVADVVLAEDDLGGTLDELCNRHARDRARTILNAVRHDGNRFKAIESAKAALDAIPPADGDEPELGEQYKKQVLAFLGLTAAADGVAASIDST